MSLPVNLWVAFFCSVNKVPDSKGFLVSFTFGEALIIQFFSELYCCNGNLLKVKLGSGEVGIRTGDTFKPDVY